MSLQYPSLHSPADANDWDYVGEGNQNIVVRYVGTNIIYRRRVLRIVKTHHNVNGPDAEIDVLFRLDFAQKVIEPLIGEEYMTRMVPVETSEAFLTALAQRIQQYRPAHRLKGLITTKAPIALLMQDLTQLWVTPNPTAAINSNDNNVITFELKPKWGFKPSASNIHEMKKKYCRFCMHAHMKSLHVRDYCPLDLYSTDQNRVGKALNILLSHPILRKKTLKVTTGQSNGWRDKQQEILLLILTKEPILRRLKSIQKSLDSIDVENIVKLYKPGMTSTTDISKWMKAIAAYLGRQKAEDDVEQKLYEYVLSMTFKDCSIMINVALTTQSEIEQHKDLKYIRVGAGQLLKYDVKVIDIDLKRVEKIPYWYELDRSITQYAEDTAFSKEKCCME